MYRNNIYINIIFICNLQTMQSCLIKWAFYHLLGWSIDVGFLDGWVSFIKWRCCTPFVEHLLHCIVEHIDTSRLAIAVGQSCCSLRSILTTFLHHHDNWPKYCYFVLKSHKWLGYFNNDLLNGIVKLTCLQFKDEIRCCQKNGIHFRHWLLREEEIF